ncbi:MAG: tetratricopeptide repeat protein [Bacteroidetes bacterium]|nr:tetratricopeptide repeat protein [Bacteroidota bacterium]
MKFRKHNIVLLLGMQLSFLFAMANKENDAALFYKNGDFEKAAIAYEQMIKQSPANAALYYNLGNAYYKSGEIAKSILNFERALRINPADEDVIYNLRLANLQTVDKIEPVPQVFYQKWWYGFIAGTSLNIRSYTVIICLWLTLIFFIVYLFSIKYGLRQFSFFASLICLVLTLTFWYVASSQSKILNDTPEAIIFATNPYVKSSPDDKGANLFMLHDGTKVTILDELKGWKKIRIANGNEGWIDEKALEKI